MVMLYEGLQEKGVKNMSDFQEHLAEQMNNPEFAAEYEAYRLSPLSWAFDYKRIVVSRPSNYPHSMRIFRS